MDELDGGYCMICEYLCILIPTKLRGLFQLWISDKLSQ
jgi:hypothetical protein